MDDLSSKTCLRKQVLKRRAHLTDEERSLGDTRLTETVTTHPQYVAAETVLLFAGYGSEVDTTGIIQDAWKKGKRVFLPKVAEGSVEPTLVFYQVDHIEELHCGYRGIPEPVGDTREYVLAEHRVDKTFVLLPGVAFDKNGNRMGYGMGFYDRFLAKHPALVPQTLAIGFACQMVEQVPVDKYDIKPNSILCL